MEFNLSEKIGVHVVETDIHVIPIQFVKEFIKKLKEELETYWDKVDDVYGFTKKELHSEIDKLAGRRLI